MITKNTEIEDEEENENTVNNEENDNIEDEEENEVHEENASTGIDNEIRLVQKKIITRKE